MKMRVVLEVDVDEVAYGLEYGLVGDNEITPDAQVHIPALIGEAVDAKAGQMGTFSVRCMSAQVMRRAR